MGTFQNPEQFSDIIASNKKIPIKTILLTFDDGYKDFRQNALPILDDLNILAIVFIVAGLIGKDNSWDLAKGSQRIELLDLDDLKELEMKGIMLGAHSMTHLDLTSLPNDIPINEIHKTRTVFGEIYIMPS